MMWNLSYQRQIATNWVIKANYMATRAGIILGAGDINQAVGSALGTGRGGQPALPTPTNGAPLTWTTPPRAVLLQYRAVDPGANSEYHGLLLAIERHFPAITPS